MSAPVFPGSTSSAMFSSPPTHHTPPTTDDSMTYPIYESAYGEAIHDPRSGKVIGVNMRVTERAKRLGYWQWSPLDHRTSTEAYKLGYSRPEDMILAYQNHVCGPWVNNICLLWCPGELDENKTPLIATIPKHMATINQEMAIRGFIPFQSFEIPFYMLSCGNEMILKARSATMYTSPMPPPVYIPPMTQVVGQSNAPHHPSGPSNTPYGGPATPVPTGLNMTAHMTMRPVNTPSMAPHHLPGPSKSPYGGPTTPVQKGLNMAAGGPVNTSSGPSTYSPRVIPNPPTPPEVSQVTSDIAEYLLDPSTNLNDILPGSPSTLSEGSGLDSPRTLPASSRLQSPSEVTSDFSTPFPNAGVSGQVTSGSPSEVASDLPATPSGMESSAPGFSPLFDNQSSSGAEVLDLDPIFGEPWYEEGPAALPSDAEAVEAEEAAHQESGLRDVYNMNTMEWLDS